MTQRVTPLAVLLCGTAAFASVVPAAAQTYRVTNLSSLVSSGLVAGMNKSGQLAGNLPTPGNPLSFTGGGFFYSNGTLTLIPGIGGQSSYASAINNLGQVTGSSNNHAFIYSNGVTTDIGALPTIDVPPTDGVAVGLSINDSGQVTGYSITQPNSIYAYAYSATAFLYSNGVMTDLGIPGGTSTGRAINNAGEIAGGVGANGAKQPFIYKNGAVTLIGPPNSDQERGDIALATAINDAGDVVGRLVDGSKTPALFAFLYSNGAITDLTQLGPGASYLDQGTAINNVGQVLLQLNQVPYLYSGGVVKDLNSLIDPTNPLYRVALLQTGVAIHDDGSMLVNGTASYSNSTPTSYLLTPQTLIFSPTTLTFVQIVGTTSASQSVTITNQATAAASITSVTVSGDFFIATNNCAAQLAPSASCTLAVTFAPLAVDARTGTLTVTAGGDYLVSLYGIGAIGASLMSSAPTVTVGVPVTLTWASTTGAICTASGGASGDGWIGQLAASGTKSVTETATGNYTYMLNCTEGSQTAQGQAIVSDTVPTVSLSANPTNLTVGQPTTLTWTSSNAASCTASSDGAGDGWGGTKAVSGTASITESTVGLITYMLTCTSGPQSAQASAQVFNNAKPTGGGGTFDILTLVVLLGLLASAATQAPRARLTAEGSLASCKWRPDTGASRASTEGQKRPNSSRPVRSAVFPS
jgi:probable HAF family extracellular repeat protein